MRSGVGKRAKVILGVQPDSVTWKYGVLHYTKEGVHCEGDASVVLVAKSCQLRTAVIEGTSKGFTYRILYESAKIYVTLTR
jgi:hypothetical protein